MMHWDYGWGMGSGWLFMVLFWVLAIAGVFFLIKLIGGSKKEAKTETAIDILKKRYASGEIGREEFEEKKKDIV
ncbi:MAG: SHOCT domain-containing protein [Thermodesulfovibrionia bacterium]|nr:SHOCT domain-containing protein [Thermodesulfovibrionia bacterium]